MYWSVVLYMLSAMVAIIQAHGSHGSGSSKENHNPLRNTKDHADHIIEELTEMVKTKSKEEMTDRELQFHYFKLHDFDNNNKLDGSEIVKAMTHHQEEVKTSGGSSQTAVQPDDDLASIVDSILDTDDSNKDGYIDFLEFMKSNGQTP